MNKYTQIPQLSVGGEYDLDQPVGVSLNSRLLKNPENTLTKQTVLISISRNLYSIVTE